MQPPLMDCLVDMEFEWRCRILKAKKVDGERFFKLHWRSTPAPENNKWGVRKVCWRDSWEPKDNVPRKMRRRFLRKRKANKIN